MKSEMSGKTENLPKSIENLYLNEDLQGLAKALGRTVITGGYVCDWENDGIAVKDKGGAYALLKNDFDWGIFQRLIAHADAIITGADYLERVKETGLEKAQNVLNQFNSGEFKFLGDWRESHGLRRNPDILVVSRSLDVFVPDILEKDRKILVFTTHTSANSEKAAKLREKGVVIVDAGNKEDDGVDGNKMYKYLNEVAHYGVVKIVTGPRALKIQMDADKLTLLYVNRVHINIPEEYSNIVSILPSELVSESKDLVKIREIEVPDVLLKDGSIVKMNLETYLDNHLLENEKEIVLRFVKKL